MEGDQASVGSRPRLLLLADATVAVAFAVGAGLQTWAQSSSTVAVAAAVASTLPIAVRRRAPVLTLVTLVAARSAHWLVDPDGETVFQLLAMLIALYSLASAASLRVAAAGVMLAVAGLVFQVSQFAEPEWVGDIVPIAVTYAIAIAAGRALHHREDETIQLRREQERLELERQQMLRDERLRIARELHDIVTHSVTVMVLHAGVLRRSGDDLSPEQDRSLEVIEMAGRQAVVELQRLVTLLRDETAPPDERGQSDLRALDVLAAPLRAAGLQVTIRREGDLTQLPPAVSLCAVRIVQEALTNVLKHASADRVDVLVSHRKDMLQLRIADDGVGLARTGATPAAGHGVLGMQERIRLFGGTLEITDGAAGGTAVHATLPAVPS